MASNPLATRDDCSQCPVKWWENQMSPKIVSQEHVNYGQPFKPRVLCRIHWAINSSATGLQEDSLLFQSYKIIWKLNYKIVSQKG